MTVPKVTHFETVEDDDEMKHAAALPVQPDTTPTTEFGTVVSFPRASELREAPETPRKGREREGRREWLTEAEVERHAAPLASAGAGGIAMQQ